LGFNHFCRSFVRSNFLSAFEKRFAAGRQFLSQFDFAFSFEFVDFGTLGSPAPNFFLFIGGFTDFHFGEISADQKK